MSADEQTRHEQMANQDRAETAEERAFNEAFIELAEMPGHEIDDMIANDPPTGHLQQRLEILLERVAMLSMPSNNSCFREDVIRAAVALNIALFDVVAARRVNDARALARRS